MTVYVLVWGTILLILTIGAILTIRLTRDTGTHTGPRERVIYRDRLISVPERHHEWLTAPPAAQLLDHQLPALMPGAGPGPSPVTTAACSGVPHALKADSPASEDSPAGRPQPHASAAGPAGDAPGPRAPEGNATARPPQGAGPGDLHTAAAAVRALALDDYLGHVPAYLHATAEFAAIDARWA